VIVTFITLFSFIGVVVWMVIHISSMKSEAQDQANRLLKDKIAGKMQRAEAMRGLLRGDGGYDRPKCWFPLDKFDFEYHETEYF